MNRPSLQLNIETKLQQFNWQIKDLSKVTGISERKLKKLFNTKLVSISNPLLKLVAESLKCEVVELFFNKDLEAASNTLSEEKLYNSLLESFPNLDSELFLESVAKVDELIQTEGKILASRERAKAYLAFYELADRLLDIS